MFKGGLPLIAVDVSSPMADKGLPTTCPTDEEARRNNSFDADEVIPGMFVGSTRIAARPVALVKHNIRRILNLSGKPVRPPGSAPLFAQLANETVLVLFVPFDPSRLETESSLSSAPQLPPSSGTEEHLAHHRIPLHEAAASDIAIWSTSGGGGAILGLDDSQRSSLDSSIGCCVTPMHTHRTFIVEVFDMTASDRLSQCMINHFDLAHRFLQAVVPATATTRGDEACGASAAEAGVPSVAICCKEGTSRSVTIACSYLMKRLRVTNEEALAMIQRVRVCAAPNIAFLGQLYAYYKAGCNADKALEKLQEYTDEFLATAAAGHSGISGEF